jgi:4-hydroxy-3-polyprenylbenzoate decarboxylase
VSDSDHKGSATYDLRAWLERVEQTGQLRQVTGASAEQEIGDAADLLQHTEGAPAVLFDEIPGYRPGFRVLVNGLGTVDRMATALNASLGLTKLQLSAVWRERILGLQPIPSVRVSDGPVMENVLRGDDVDMTIFPAPKWHPGDGGRYLGTGSYDVTRDPDDGWVNVGTYRVMVHDATRLGYYISPGKHGRIHRQKYFDRNQPCPVAMVFGSHPLLFLAASNEIPFGMTEYDWVGGMLGEAVEVIQGPVTGLPIPANAEIVIEGWASAEQMLPEGPFGEWTGYYASGERAEPVLTVEAVYHRDDPVILGCPPGRPPDELSRYRAPLRSALLYEELAKAGVPDVEAVWQHEAGGSRMFTVVAVRQRYPGHARQVLHVASQCHTGAYAGKYVVVVDEDIDPSNLEEVIWAVCTRSDPADSIDFVRRAWSTPLDPRLTPQQRSEGDFTNSRALIDATRPYEWRDKFPRVNVPPMNQRAAALERWSYLLR